MGCRAWRDGSATVGPTTPNDTGARRIVSDNREAAPRATLFGLDIPAVTLDGAVSMILRAVAQRRRALVIHVNVDQIVRIAADSRVREVYERAELVFADGMPLVWLSWLIGRPRLPERVNGASVFERLCALAPERGLRVFFLGAAPGVAATAATVLRERYPGLNVVGTYSPPLGFEGDREENERIVALCNAQRPDILFLGFGAPKQEIWAAAHLERLDVGAAVCVGGTFDFVAGRVVRAPSWIQSAGFEWAWRLAHEPRRLWKRYLVRDAGIVPLALREVGRRWLRGRESAGRSSRPEGPSSTEADSHDT